MSDALEKKWDRVWSAACLVAATVERYDGYEDETLRDIALDQLVRNCRDLRSVVDQICPTPEGPQSSSDGSAKR